MIFLLLFGFLLHMAVFCAKPFGTKSTPSMCADFNIFYGFWHISLKIRFIISHPKQKSKTFSKKILFFLKLFFAAKLLVDTGVDIDEHGILPEAADLIPGDDDLLTFAESKCAAIEEHHHGDDSAAGKIDLGVGYVAEAFSIAYVDDFFVLQIIDTASIHKIFLPK